jgi:hypothetical protein
MGGGGQGQAEVQPRQRMGALVGEPKDCMQTANNKGSRRRPAVISEQSPAAASCPPRT